MSAVAWGLAVAGATVAALAAVADGIGERDAFARNRGAEVDGEGAVAVCQSSGTGES